MAYIDYTQKTVDWICDNVPAIGICSRIGIGRKLELLTYLYSKIDNANIEWYKKNGYAVDWYFILEVLNETMDYCPVDVYLKDTANSILKMIED